MSSDTTSVSELMSNVSQVVHRKTHSISYSVDEWHQLFVGYLSDILSHVCDACLPSNTDFSNSRRVSAHCLSNAISPQILQIFGLHLYLSLKPMIAIIETAFRSSESTFHIDLHEFAIEFRFDSIEMTQKCESLTDGYHTVLSTTTQVKDWTGNQYFSNNR